MAFVNAVTNTPAVQVLKSGSPTAAGGTALDGNFDALNSRVPSEALLLDGSKPMAAALDMGSNNINSVNVVNAASLVGPLTGNVTGDVTGNVTGDVTGNLTGNVTGDCSGNAGGITGATPAPNGTYPSPTSITIVNGIITAIS